jgi:transcriptional regulator with XRE-family HTH domain
MKLSDKIRILRKARGLSQEQLGYSLSRVNKDGISRQTVSDWENGKFEPKLENIRDLAEVLNVSFDTLLDETIDLEDDKVLYAVLNNEKGKKKVEIDNSFSYSIYAFERSKKDIVRLVLAVVLDVLAVLSVIIIVNSIVKNDFQWYTFVAFVVAGGSFGGGISLTIMLPRIIKSLIKGTFTVHFGTLTNSYLHVSTYKTASNSIYIPLEKIERIELGPKANKYHGSVDIIIKDRNKPLTLIDIKEPKKLVDVFNSLDSYVENPDEIKIL